MTLQSNALPPKPLAPYESMPLPSLADRQLEEILRRHGLEPDGPIRRLASSGVVHSLWALGTEWVLRVPKNEAMSIGDHRCEAVAIPIARQAGVRTPELVLFDDSLLLLDVPYSVVTRVDGTDLAGEPFDHEAYREVGRELARLHAADLTSLEHPWLRDPSDLPAEDRFDDVLAAGLLHTEAIDWLMELCSRLDSIISAGPAPPRVFVHDDIKPDNVMIGSAGSVHLIDWGDAGSATQPMTSSRCRSDPSSSRSPGIGQNGWTTRHSKRESSVASLLAACRTCVARPFSGRAGIDRSRRASPTC